MSTLSSLSELLSLVLPAAPTLPCLPSAPALPTATTAAGSLTLGSVVNVIASQPLVITGLADCNSLTTFNIEQGATLGLEGTVDLDLLTTINFAGSDGTLILSSSFTLEQGSQIEGFAGGDQIDYKGVKATSLTTCYTPPRDVDGVQVAPGYTTVNLYNAAGQPVGSLRLTGDYRNELHLASDGSGGTVLTCFCLLAGTRVLTAHGERPVETLRAGDVVLTPDGPRAITRVGARELDTGSHPDPDAIRPIRIAAHAFGRAEPARDLLVSPDHAIYVDGVMIPAKHLVNGCTVTRETSITRPHYLHVQLQEHGVLYAEGLTVESFLDIGGGDSFFEADTVAGAPAAPHPDMIRAAWDASGYAPLVVTGPALDTVRARLAARAEQAGRPRLAQAA